MLRRTSLCLMIALALGACSDSDSGPRLASIDELRVVKVSGDQVSPVRGQQVAASRIHAVAGASYSIGPDGYTSEPLVARVEVASQAKGGGTGPSGAVIPTGTLVHWHIPSSAGKLYAATTATDDSAHVINRWAPGTRAGEFQVTAGRLVGAEIVTDETWTLVVEPGPIVRFAPPGSEFTGPAPREIPGSTWRDAYGNPGAWRIEADSVFRVLGTEFGTAAARTIEPIDMTPGAKGEAVICITTADGPIAVAHARYGSGTDRTTMWIRVHGHPDTTRGSGVYQLSDCS